MGLEHLLEMVLLIVVLPTVAYKIKEWFDRKKKRWEGTQVHAQNSVILNLMVETMATFKEQLNRLYFMVGESNTIVKDIHNKMTEEEDAKKLAKQIKDAINDSNDGD